MASYTQADGEVAKGATDEGREIAADMGDMRARRSETDPDAPLVAYVMARDVIAASAPEIVRTVRSAFGADARVVDDPVNGEVGVSTLDVDGIRIMIIVVPRPIPASVLPEVARSPADPEGSIADHAEHAIVGTVGRHVGHEDSLRAALAVLKVCFALCETERVSAVMWHLSSALLPRDAFMAVLSPETLERVPIPIWAFVRFQPFSVEDPDGTRPEGLAAWGFRRFIGRDIEFEPSTVALQDQYTRLLNLGFELLKRGLYVKDGESCGLSADDVFRARYVDQGRLTPARSSRSSSKNSIEQREGWRWLNPHLNRH